MLPNVMGYILSHVKLALCVSWMQMYLLLFVLLEV